jgi:hypothetical protein
MTPNAVTTNCYFVARIHFIARAKGSNKNNVYKLFDILANLRDGNDFDIKKVFILVKVKYFRGSSLRHTSRYHTAF